MKKSIYILLLLLFINAPIAMGCNIANVNEKYAVNNVIFIGEPLVCTSKDSFQKLKVVKVYKGASRDFYTTDYPCDSKTFGVGNSYVVYGKKSWLKKNIALSIVMPVRPMISCDIGSDGSWKPT